ncbi:MAG: glycosyltransferase [Longimicrobiales bacterium]
MRVVLVSGMYAREGQISCGFVHRQVLALIELGIEVRVVCPVARLSSRRPADENARGLIGARRHTHIDDVPVTFLPYWNVPHRVSAGFVAVSMRHGLRAELRRLRRAFDFQLIHANRLFPMGFAALPVARKLGVPLVVGARGSDVHTNPYRNRSVRQYTCETIRSARLFAVSEALARGIELLAKPAQTVRVAYNGVDTARFRPIVDRQALRQRLGLPARGIGICMVSRIVREKGVVELVRAFERVSAALPDSWLAVIGDGPFRDGLAAEVRRSGLDQRVYLPGAQPNERIADWLNAADLFTLPSYNEGLPNVVLEAMACGLAVVATDVGGTAEVVADGVTGTLVPPRDAVALASALLALATDDAARRRMAHNGLERIRGRFSWHQSARTLIDLYEDAMRSRAATVVSAA